MPPPMPPPTSPPNNSTTTTLWSTFTMSTATTTTTLTVGGRATVLGSFTKALVGSATLNFSTSGGVNCDTGCPYHPASTSNNAAPDVARCYAATCEARPDRRSLAAKLERHDQTDAADLITAAMDELADRAYRLPWFRLSAFGSVPARVPSNMRRMLEKLTAAGTPVHLPIETARKASRYRRALEGVGVSVRESVASMRRFRTAPEACSIVAGTMQQPPRERIKVAQAVAGIRRKATRRRCIVCPAVSTTFIRLQRNAKSQAVRPIKCGMCTACACPDTDVVYPVHR